nr:self-incompatibility ribonuclease [Solanum habrochaites]
MGRLNNKMIKSQFVSALFVFFFSLSPIYGDFDYMQLVLTWPRSFCYPRRFCNRIPPNNFTIHGLWPDKMGIPGHLQFCTSEKYEIFEPGNVLDALDQHWIQLKFEREAGIRDQPLWRDQYKKHGTCCLSRYNQLQYFLLAMRLKEKFDLLTTLRTHGITPGTKHTYKKIQDAIKTVTQEVPDLKCIQYTKGVLELYEIGICFTPEADSPSLCRQSNSCHPTENPLILFR